MRKCNLTITTAVDGQEQEFTAMGEMELSLRSALLRYREQNAITLLKLEGNCASVEREGDYTLSLQLTEQTLTGGSLGIGGGAGEIKTYTHKVGYSVGKDSLLAVLHYDLIIGGEKQEMKLRILARGEKAEGGKECR